LGWLYETSLKALSVFSVAAQLAAIPGFLAVGRRLRALEAERAEL
jgi:hypothetical protein